MDQQITTIICAAILSIALIASYIHCKRNQNEIDAQAHPSIKETIAEASDYFGTDAAAAKSGITEVERQIRFCIHNFQINIRIAYLI